MSQTVFVDTAAWIALLDADDNHHARALQVVAALRQQHIVFLTTEFVLLEVADALCGPSQRQQTVAFLAQLPQAPRTRIVPLSTTLWADGLSLCSQRLDKEWGLTDCTSFAVMTQEGITEALTSDHHFVQAGFVKLL